MTKRDFKQLRPIEMLVKKLFGEAEAVRKRLEAGRAVTSMEVLKLDTANYLQDLQVRGEDMLLAVVNHAVTFPRPHVTLGMLMYVCVPRERADELPDLISQLKHAQNGSSDERVQALRQEAVVNLQRQHAFYGNNGVRKQEKLAQKEGVRCNGSKEGVA